MNTQTLPRIGTAHPVTLNAPAWTADIYGRCREVDISDIWQDYMDPENVRGEVATAFVWMGDENEPPVLRGISVSDGVTVYYDRLRVMEEILDTAAVWNIELHEWEAR